MNTLTRPSRQRGSAGSLALNVTIGAMLGPAAAALFAAFRVELCGVVRLRKAGAEAAAPTVGGMHISRNPCPSGRVAVAVPVPVPAAAAPPIAAAPCPFVAEEETGACSPLKSAARQPPGIKLLLLLLLLLEAALLSGSWVRSSLEKPPRMSLRAVRSCSLAPPCDAERGGGTAPPSPWSPIELRGSGTGGWSKPSAEET